MSTSVPSIAAMRYPRTAVARERSDRCGNCPVMRRYSHLGLQVLQFSLALFIFSAGTVKAEMIVGSEYGTHRCCEVVGQ